jgi:hypothetical protein
MFFPSLIVWIYSDSLAKLLNLIGSRQRSTCSNVARNPDALRRKNVHREINNKVQENTTHRNYTAGYYRNEGIDSVIVLVVLVVLVEDR